MLKKELDNHEWNIREMEAYQFMTSNPEYFKLVNELSELRKKNAVFQLLDGELHEDALEKQYLSIKEQKKILKYIKKQEELREIYAEAYYRAGMKHCFHFFSQMGSGTVKIL